jgi:tetratricopeptide (TPR) repeat protein
LKPPLIVQLCLAALLLVPGRLQGYLWRDLFLGRRFFDIGDFQRSIQHSQIFLSTLEKKPWLRGLWWLSWSMYTRDAKAMTLNNLGAAQLNSGQLEAAKTALDEALQIDPAYPMPHLNLALLFKVRGQEEEANFHQQRARELGLHGDKVDRLVQSGIKAYASYQTQI